MNLLLICDTPIINRIFTLICTRANIELNIVDHTDIKESYDLMIVDEKFIDEDFNIIKQYTKRLGAITNQEMSFNLSKDFIIPRPFLPNKLLNILEKEIELINNLDVTKIEDHEEVIVDDIPLVNNESSSDESIIEPSNIRNGGVLDFSEISKINDILEEDIIEESSISNNDWDEISEIVDDALNEVEKYEFDLYNSYSKKDKSNYEIELSKYNIDELRPLFQKLDQNIIDSLSNGKKVDISLVLKAEN